MNSSALDKNAPVDWLRQIAQKNVQAFENFYDRYSSLAFTMALRILGSRNDAEEVLQDVFMQVWNQAQNYRQEKGSPEAWLITLARSRALDKFRSLKNRRNKTQSLDELQEQGHNEAVTAPDSGTLNRMAADSVLSELPEIPKKIMSLAYIQGMTQSEIASALNMPLGTVKTHMRSSLSFLRERAKNITPKGGE